MPFNIIIIMIVMIIIQRNLFLLYYFSSQHFVGWGVVGAGGVWASSLAFVARLFGLVGGGWGVCGNLVSGFGWRPIGVLRGLGHWGFPNDTVPQAGR